MDNFQGLPREFHTVKIKRFYMDKPVEQVFYFPKVDTKRTLTLYDKTIKGNINSILERFKNYEIFSEKIFEQVFIQKFFQKLSHVEEFFFNKKFIDLSQLNNSIATTTGDFFNSANVTTSVTNLNSSTATIADDFLLDLTKDANFVRKNNNNYSFIFDHFLLSRLHSYLVNTQNYLNQVLSATEDSFLFKKEQKLSEYKLQLEVYDLNIEECDLEIKEYELEIKEYEQGLKGLQARLDGLETFKKDLMYFQKFFFQKFSSFLYMLALFIDKEEKKINLKFINEVESKIDLALAFFFKKLILKTPLFLEIAKRKQIFDLNLEIEERDQKINLALEERQKIRELDLATLRESQQKKVFLLLTKKKSYPFFNFLLNKEDLKAIHDFLLFNKKFLDKMALLDSEKSIILVDKKAIESKKHFLVSASNQLYARIKSTFPIIISTRPIRPIKPTSFPQFSESVLKDLSSIDNLYLVFTKDIVNLYLKQKNDFVKKLNCLMEALID